MCRSSILIVSSKEYACARSIYILTGDLSIINRYTQINDRARQLMTYDSNMCDNNLDLYTHKQFYI